MCGSFTARSSSRRVLTDNECVLIGKLVLGNFEVEGGRTKADATRGVVMTSYTHMKKQEMKRSRVDPKSIRAYVKAGEI